MARKKSPARAKRRTRTESQRGAGTRRSESTRRAKPSTRATPKKSTSAKSASTLARGSLLSRSTLRAKWVESPDEHADYPGQTLATRNHDVIRRWAEERGAIPATVPGTERDGRPGVLTFDFPGYGGERLRHISWDEWFRTFDERNLVFKFQERLRNGDPSNHFNFDSPEREAA